MAKKKAKKPKYVTPSIKGKKPKIRPGVPKKTPRRPSVNLGNFANVLPTKVILRIKLNATAATIFQARAGARAATVPKALQVSELRKAIDEMVYQPLVSWIEERAIREIVPSDTGALRMAMEDSMTGRGGSILPSKLSSRVDMTIYLHTDDIPYAFVVNNMPRKWLVHPGSWHRNYSDRGGRHALYDPGSTTHWFKHSVDMGRAAAVDVYRNFIRNYVAPLFARYPLLFPDPLRTAKAMFTGYNPGQISV